MKVVGEIITHLHRNASHSGGGKIEVGLGKGNNLGMELVGSNVVYGKRQPWWEGLWRKASYASLMLTRCPFVGWRLA